MEISFRDIFFSLNRNGIIPCYDFLTIGIVYLYIFTPKMCIRDRLKSISIYIASPFLTFLAVILTIAQHALYRKQNYSFPQKDCNYSAIKEKRTRKCASHSGRVCILFTNFSDIRIFIAVKTVCYILTGKLSVVGIDCRINNFIPVSYTHLPQAHRHQELL